MSDEIPGPEVKGMIVVDDWVDESVLGAWHFVTPGEVVAVVRRGVESGEIEGAEHTVSIGDSGELHVSPVLLLDEAQTYLVIPVGGKDV